MVSPAWRCCPSAGDPVFADVFHNTHCVTYLVHPNCSTVSVRFRLDQKALREREWLPELKIRDRIDLMRRAPASNRETSRSHQEGRVLRRGDYRPVAGEFEKPQDRLLE